jgi:hypothetical protein
MSLTKRSEWMYATLVALAFDEAAKCEIGIEPDTDDDALAALGAQGAITFGLGSTHALDGARAHFHGHDGRVAFDEPAHHLAQAGQQVRIDPVDREAVRRQQLQRAVAFHGLQGAHPGVEMLARQLILQGAHAARPE